ncbi:carboxyl transferase domain-containing protein [Paeniglutamicibacter sp. NPDC091659]|uniref:carboxyl transferase domain-containing protein n=1 Tax=Paeniglutamicibacter sp. NPDC091659 TaxID=3364389 RepID=UPI0038034E58
MPALAPTPRVRRSAREMMDTVLDPGSFRSWDTPADYSDQEPGYRAELLAAAERSGVDESVITGEGSINGRRVAIIVNEFSFLGGSIGRFAAGRLVQAFERATAERLPVLASPASGGTRMQEGTPAFVGMVKIAAAVRAHRTTRQPYLVYLRHPTTGGVMASWGSLGHITVAEPGALLGFLGPRVYEAIYGEPFPPGVQVAENLHRLGLIDAVVPVEELAGVLTRALEILSHGSESRAPAESEDAAPPTAEPEDRVLSRDEVWASIMATRHPRRPTVRHLIKYGAADVLQLSGTGGGQRDARTYLALARFGNSACVFVGQDRSAGDTEPLGPAFLREAQRGMALAESLGIPLVSVIDTEGAALSRQAEEGGMAAEIARSIAGLIGLRTPTVSILLGQGTGGGALALIPADRTIAASSAWLSPLPPEGASAIVHRSTDRAAELAHAQAVDAYSLRRRGIVDVLVPEPSNSERQPREFIRGIADALEVALEELAGSRLDTLVSARVAKYAAIG